MRTICSLCSLILMLSFTGIQAQTGSAPAAVDSIQSQVIAPAPAPENPIAAESPVVKAVPAMPTRESLNNNGLKGTALFSCNGFYYYNKHTETMPGYVSYYGPSFPEYEVTYRTYVYSLLVNGSYFVTNEFSIGGTLGVLSMIFKTDSDYEDFNNNYFYDNYSISANIIGPRLAYYHGKKDSKVLPFAAFEYDLITAENYNDTAIRIGAGVLLQPKPHFGISFGLDYLKFGEEENSTNIIGVLGLTGILY